MGSYQALTRISAEFCMRVSPGVDIWLRSSTGRSMRCYKFQHSSEEFSIIENWFYKNRKKLFESPFRWE